VRVCGLCYEQKSGVTRHHRDVHEFSLCLHCSGFKWHRRHELRKHLEEQHPDVHVPAALAEATGYHRRATMIKNRQQGQPLPPVLDATHVSSPAVAYDPRPEPTMPTTSNGRRRREYSPELALFVAAYAHVAFSPTVRRAPPPNSVDVFIWG
jgi:hypothetical protein